MPLRGCSRARITAPRCHPDNPSDTLAQRARPGRTNPTAREADMSTTTTVTIPVREMQVGDVVRAHGLVLLVDVPPIMSTSHEFRAGGCFWTDALVIEREDRCDVPRSWTNRTPDHFGRVEGSDRPRPGVAADDHRDRWALQGNDLARWTVERDTITDDGESEAN